MFFFPYYHIGGAELVHLQIINALNGHKTYTLFTKQSKSEALLDHFKLACDCSVIFKFIRHNGYIKTLFIKKLSKLLNNSAQLQSVFGCNTEFFYEVLPHLHSEIKRIDLTHAFSTPDYGIEQFSLSYVDYLDQRVVINNKTKDDFISQYQVQGVNTSENDKLVCIPNGIAIQETLCNTLETSNVTVGFFGRWSKEKRPELFLEIAKEVKQHDMTIKFKMAGTSLETHKKEIEDSDIEYLGELLEQKVISDFYKSLDVLVLTSYREGFPLVIMEAMSYGVIVMATNVGSISDHVKTNENGFLISETDPDQIVESISEKIVALSKDSEQRKKMHTAAYSYAKSNFGIDQFNKAYLKLLINA